MKKLIVLLSILGSYSICMEDNNYQGSNPFKSQYPEQNNIPKHHTSLDSFIKGRENIGKNDIKQNNNNFANSEIQHQQQNYKDQQQDDAKEQEKKDILNEALLIQHEKPNNINSEQEQLFSDLQKEKEEQEKENQKKERQKFFSNIQKQEEQHQKIMSDLNNEQKQKKQKKQKQEQSWNDLKDQHNKQQAEREKQTPSQFNQEEQVKLILSQIHELPKNIQKMILDELQENKEEKKINEIYKEKDKLEINKILQNHFTRIDKLSISLTEQYDEKYKPEHNLFNSIKEVNSILNAKLNYETVLTRLLEKGLDNFIPNIKNIIKILEELYKKNHLLNYYYNQLKDNPDEITLKKIQEEINQSYVHDKNIKENKNNIINDIKELKTKVNAIFLAANAAVILYGLEYTFKRYKEQQDNTNTTVVIQAE